MTPIASEGRTCGGCTLCCSRLAIDELDKPADQICTHCVVGSGCAIYADRPPVCRAYACGWLLNPGLPDHWRPETTGMVLGRNLAGLPTLVTDPTHPDAWRSEPFITDLRRIAADRDTAPGGCVVIIGNAERVLLYAEREIRLS